MLRVERLRPFAYEELKAEDLVPIKRRVFEFWDREGELYIYKERWESGTNR